MTNTLFLKELQYINILLYDGFFFEGKINIIYQITHNLIASS